MIVSNLVFDHVHLISKDPKLTAVWYVEKLGGKVLYNSEFGGAPQVVVGFSGATLIIRGQRKGETAAEKKGLQWGTDHFGFRVDADFDAFCSDLKNKGVNFSLEPMDFTPTIRIAFIDAPDGVSIELLQRK
ncbi:MAG TPA: VOC family protein [Thermodesulfobacteriota bacterium]|nr:VOC family protein [Thermodesulfobacteriota bacterium]